MTHEEIIALAKEAGLPYLPTPNSALVRIVKEAVLIEREACAKVCEEMHDHYSALKDTALLNGDVDLSNASSGEPRACEFLATAIRKRGAA